MFEPGKSPYISKIYFLSYIKCNKEEDMSRLPTHNPYDNNNNSIKSEHYIEYTKYLNNGVSIKSYDCVKCGGSFTRMSQLDSHIMRKHKEVRGFSCPYCEHSSVSTKSLEAHIYTKHPPHGKNSLVLNQSSCTLN